MHLLGSSPFSPDVTLLSDGELGTLALGEGDPGLDALTDDEDVGDTGGEGTVKRILNVDDVESSNVLLPVHNNTSTTHVTTTGDHDDVAGIELDEVGDLSSLELELDGVVDLDEGVGVTDGATVVGDDVGNTTSTEGDLADLEELVGGLLGGDAVDGETALDVVEETEVLAGLLDGDHILEASGVGGVGADLSIDFDQTLLDNGGDFTASKGVLQAVAEEDAEGEGFAELMGTGGGTGGVGTAKLVQHP